MLQQHNKVRETPDQEKKFSHLHAIQQSPESPKEAKANIERERKGFWTKLTGLFSGKTEIQETTEMSTSKVKNLIKKENRKKEVVNFGLTIEEITKLTPESAHELLKYKGVTIELPNVTTLDKESAEILFKRADNSEPRIELPGLSLIDEENGPILGQADVDLSGVQQFADKKVTTHHTYRHYTDTNKTAQAVGNWDRHRVSFPRMHEIDLTVLENLCSANIKHLSLGLLEVGEKEAETLLKFQGETLSLNQLTSLSPSAAETLSKTNCDTVELHGITEISPETAKALSSFKGTLSLRGITALTQETAKNISKFSGNQLLLDGVETLNDASATELAKSKCTHINLSGLSNFGEETAKAFSDFHGTIVLPSFKEVDTGTMIAIANWQSKNIHLHIHKASTETLAELLKSKNIDKKTIEITCDSIQNITDLLKLFPVPPNTDIVIETPLGRVYQNTEYQEIMLHNKAEKSSVKKWCKDNKFKFIPEYASEDEEN